MLAQYNCLNQSQEGFLQWLPYLWWFPHCNKGQKWFLVVVHVLFTCSNPQRQNSSNIAAGRCPKWIIARTTAPREYLFFLGNSNAHQSEEHTQKAANKMLVGLTIAEAFWPFNKSNYIMQSQFLNFQFIITNEFSRVGAPLPACTTGQTLLFLNCLWVISLTHQYSCHQSNGTGWQKWKYVDKEI